MRETLPPGREFELAVANFAQAISPSAVVRHNHRVKDHDFANKDRQVDCWIEGKLSGHWPLTVLVSCKDHKRRQDVGAIEQFMGEIRSTRPDVAVIYSSSGFAEDALEKAKKNNIICCTLYRDDPADIPKLLFLWGYCGHASYQLRCLENNLGAELCWGDIFELPVGESQSKTVLQCIEDEFRRREKTALEASKENPGLPPNWAVEHEFRVIDGDTLSKSLRIRVDGMWKLFRARMEAHLVSGSYCFKDDSFCGSIATPSVDMESAHPGTGWEECADNHLPAGFILMLRYGGKLREAARQHYGSKRLTDQ